MTTGRLGVEPSSRPGQAPRLDRPCLRWACQVGWFVEGRERPGWPGTEYRGLGRGGARLTDQACFGDFPRALPLPLPLPLPWGCGSIRKSQRWRGGMGGRHPLLNLEVLVLIGGLLPASGTAVAAKDCPNPACGRTCDARAGLVRRW